MKTNPLNFHCECGNVMVTVYSDGIHCIVRCLNKTCARTGERRKVLLADAQEVPLEEADAKP